MTLKCAFAVFRKDMAMSPRSSVFFLVLVMPIVMTLLFQLVFGSLFDSKPRLGVVDYGASGISAAVQTIEGIDVVFLDDAEGLMNQVEQHDLDAGMILEPGFDEAVVNGSRPELTFYVSGRSLASDRMILAVTAIDLVRGVEGNASPVVVEVTTLGETDQLPIADRLIPMLVLYAIIIAGVFATAFNLVQERESRTLTAVLVSPVQMSDVLAAKGLFGFLLALVMALVTLGLNGVLSADYAALFVTMVVAALMSVEVGLIFATASKDMKTLYTLVKTLNIILFGPVFFYLFPSWPQWIAKLFPSYWFFDPMFEISLKGAGLTDVWQDLLIAYVICIALVPLVALLGRRMARSLALS
jgi:ABC-2 type transport system permease protein